jgi:hypothetical protein
MLSYLLVSLAALVLRNDNHIRFISVLVVISYLLSLLIFKYIPTQPALLITSTFDLLAMLLVFKFVEGLRYQIGYFTCFIVKMWMAVSFQYPLLGSPFINYYIIRYGDTFILEALLIKIFSGTKSKSFRDYIFLVSVICFVIFF